MWGPASVSSERCLFYVSFLYAYIRFTWLYLIRNKSEVVTKFLKFRKLVEVQFNFRLKFFKVIRKENIDHCYHFLHVGDST